VAASALAAGEMGARALSPQRIHAANPRELAALQIAAGDWVIRTSPDQALEMWRHCLSCYRVATLAAGVLPQSHMISTVLDVPVSSFVPESSAVALQDVYYCGVRIAASLQRECACASSSDRINHNACACPIVCTLNAQLPPLMTKLYSERYDLLKAYDDTVISASQAPTRAADCAAGNAAASAAVNSRLSIDPGGREEALVRQAFDVPASLTFGRLTFTLTITTTLNTNAAASKGTNAASRPGNAVVMLRTSESLWLTSAGAHSATVSLEPRNAVLATPDQLGNLNPADFSSLTPGLVNGERAMRVRLEVGAPNMIQHAVAQQMFTDALLMERKYAAPMEQEQIRGVLAGVDAQGGRRPPPVAGTATSTRPGARTTNTAAAAAVTASKSTKTTPVAVPTSTMTHARTSVSHTAAFTNKAYRTMTDTPASSPPALEDVPVTAVVPKTADDSAAAATVTQTPTLKGPRTAHSVYLARQSATNTDGLSHNTKATVTTRSQDPAMGTVSQAPATRKSRLSDQPGTTDSIKKESGAKGLTFTSHDSTDFSASSAVGLAPSVNTVATGDINSNDGAHVAHTGTMLQQHTARLEDSTQHLAKITKTLGAFVKSALGTCRKANVKDTTHA